MPVFNRLLAPWALAAACLGLSASEYTHLASELHAIWPAKHRVGVVCDAAAQRQELDILSLALGPEAKLLVIDAHSTLELGTAVNALRAHQADFVVLLPGDRLLCEGSPLRVELARNLANFGIPCMGTTAKSVEDGALFAIGSDTDNRQRIHTQPLGSLRAELPPPREPSL